MTLPKLFQRHLHLQMRMNEKKLSIVRWTQFYPTELGSLLNDYIVANLRVASECSKRILRLMALLISTRLVMWTRVITRKKANISLILVHMFLD
jgi:hypothetical protein